MSETTQGKQKPIIKQREAPSHYIDRLKQQKFSPVLAKLFASRGVYDAHLMDTDLKDLESPTNLLNAKLMAEKIADGIQAGETFTIVADYDSDGATACTVAYRFMKDLGAYINYLVPNRFVHGYGLTPGIVELVKERFPLTNFLITVDNGIASIDGVKKANELGLKVLITDHHLAGDELPPAECIVNPNQPGCNFASKSMAGCGVAFYVMILVRRELITRGVLTEETAPSSIQYLPYVAIGTVADVVRLDKNNRILVEKGLQQIRKGFCSVGIKKLITVSGKKIEKLTASDIGFGLGPRINASGRLEDASTSIDLLTTDDIELAGILAKKLDDLNKERRDIENNIKDEALFDMESFNPKQNYSIVLHNEAWHQGVIGIVASRIKDTYHRPTIIFAKDGDDYKGSGRSIEGFHLRDAIDMVYKRKPYIIKKFGGHAMAAGVGIYGKYMDEFIFEFEKAARELLEEDDLVRVIKTDGSLPTESMTMGLAETLGKQVWGQGFPTPTFYDTFNIVEQKLIGKELNHLQLTLEKDGKTFPAMAFFRTEELTTPTIKAIYQLTVSDFRGRKVQLLIDYIEDLEGNPI